VSISSNLTLEVENKWLSLPTASLDHQSTLSICDSENKILPTSVCDASPLVSFSDISTDEINIKHTDCIPPLPSDTRANDAFWEGIQADEGLRVGFSPQRKRNGEPPVTLSTLLSMHTLNCESDVRKAAMGHSPLVICVIVPQPRKLFYWAKDHTLTLGNVSGRWPNLPRGAPPDDVRLRAVSGEANEPIGASCQLVTPRGGLAVPGWHSNSTIEIPSLRWGTQLAENGVDRIPFWGDAAAGWADGTFRAPPNALRTLSIPSPTHATVYACTIGGVAIGALGRVALHDDSGVVNVTVRIEHTAFSWNAQARSRWPADNTFDEFAGAPDALLACYVPRVASPLRLKFGSLKIADASAALCMQPHLSNSTVAARRALCERADAPGAWVAASEPGAIGPSRDGRWWRAHDCVFHTPRLVPRCLASKWSGVAFFGDSHIRRAWKDLIGLTPPHKPVVRTNVSTASAWCAGREDSRPCICEDGNEGGSFDESIGVFGGGDTASPRIAWAWGGTALVGPSWRDELATALGRLRSLNDGRLPPLIVFDLVHWDAAFSTYFRFSREIDAFAAALAAATVISGSDLSMTNFSQPSPGEPNWAKAAAEAAKDSGQSVLVYRTPTFFAGEDTGNLRKFTSLRMELFHVRALKALRSALGKRLLVWDVFAMGAARAPAVSVNISASCWSGHEPSEDVGIENQVLLNALCN
jgi:hypothetical protein